MDTPSAKATSKNKPNLTQRSIIASSGIPMKYFA